MAPENSVSPLLIVLVRLNPVRREKDNLLQLIRTLSKPGDEKLKPEIRCTELALVTIFYATRIVL